MVILLFVIKKIFILSKINSSTNNRVNYYKKLEIIKKLKYVIIKIKEIYLKIFDKKSIENSKKKYVTN